MAANREQLFRAGDLLHAIFLEYRKSTFDLHLDRVEKGKDGRLHLYDGFFGRKTPVPWKDFPGLSDEENEAVLTYNACHQTFACMPQLMEKALEGIYSSIQEVSILCKENIIAPIAYRVVNTPTAYLTLRHEQAPSDRFLHNIFKIKLKDGMEYAFDLSGAQFGSYRKVIPWEEYKTQMVRFEIQTVPLRSGIDEENDQHHDVRAHLERAERDNEALVVIGNEEHDPRSFILQQAAGKQMDLSVDEWLQVKNTTLTGLLKLPPQSFADEKDKLLKYLNRKMAKSVKAAVVKQENMAEGEHDENSCVFSAMLRSYPLRCEQDPGQSMEMTAEEKELEADHAKRVRAQRDAEGGIGALLNRLLV